MVLFWHSLVRQYRWLNCFRVNLVQLRRGLRGRFFPGVLQEQQEWNHQQKDYAHEPEGFDEGQHAGMLLDHAIQGGESFARGSYRVGSVEVEVGAQSLKKAKGLQT